ncbi:pyruvate kinase [Bradyrhizobium sp. SSUT112]|nr:pyruvate kinase [Bradyrhizobium sp. SSUT112]MDH2357521.1 pyruvate kinase [Bradyrhizobium sp. SSUT112]
MRALYLSGADTFRLNFSHGTQDDHVRVYVSIRTLQREFGRTIGGLHRR